MSWNVLCLFESEIKQTIFFRQRFSNAIPMNPTHVSPSLPLSFVNKCQLFFQQMSESLLGSKEKNQNKASILSLQKMLKKHKYLQFQLLEERSFLPPACVLRKTDVEDSFLALSKDQTFIDFSSSSRLKGYWEMDRTNNSLKLTYDQQLVVGGPNTIQFPQINHIQSFSNHYLIVNCQTEEGEIQRIYTLYQKGK